MMQRASWGAREFGNLIAEQPMQNGGLLQDFLRVCHSGGQGGEPVPRSGKTPEFCEVLW
jgi:hypothetical protein